MHRRFMPPTPAYPAKSRRQRRQRIDNTRDAVGNERGEFRRLTSDKFGDALEMSYRIRSKNNAVRIAHLALLPA